MVGELDDRAAANEASPLAHNGGDEPACGHSNPVWSTDSRLWNEVVGGDQDEEATGVLCLACFMERADEHFDGSRWRILGWHIQAMWGRP